MKTLLRQSEKQRNASALRPSAGQRMHPPVVLNMMINSISILYYIIENILDNN